LPKIEFVGVNSKAPQSPTLANTISENEIGLLYFDDYVGSITQANRRGLIAYDIDLDENATFSLQALELFDDQLERSHSPKADLAGHFTIRTPSYAQNAASHSVQIKTSVNLLNEKSLDFEALDAASFIDPNTGIASKSIKLSVK
jgi:hypothetical protein